MPLFFSFAGRIGRGKFWLGNVIMFAAIMAVYLVIINTLGEPISMRPATKPGEPPVMLTNTVPLIAYGIASLFSTFASFALMIKRCHDRGKSGWWSLILFIPLAGMIWWLVDLGIIEGQPETNAWGPPAVQRA